MEVGTGIRAGRGTRRLENVEKRRGWRFKVRSLSLSLKVARLQGLGRFELYFYSGGVGYISYDFG